MLQSSYGTTPSTRNEALQQVIDRDENGHFCTVYDFEICKEADEDVAPCNKCLSYPNSSCKVVREQWMCSFCGSWNAAAGVGTRQWGANYAVSLGASPAASQMVFVVDLLMEAAELQELKTHVATLVGNISGRFGLITLTDGAVTVSRGGGRAEVAVPTDEYRKFQLERLDPRHILKYIGEVSELWLTAEELIVAVAALEALPCCPVRDERPRRGTGIAFFVAALFNMHRVGFALKVLAFLSGPCTQGPGKVVSKSYKNHMRGHSELQNKKARYSSQAADYYKSLREFAPTVNYDVFITSLDQTGVWEMSQCLNHVVQYDTLVEDRFHLDMNAYSRRLRNEIIPHQVNFITSDPVLVDGCFGPVRKLPPLRNNYSGTERGIGKTTTWAYNGTLLSADELSLCFSLCLAPSARQSSKESATPNITLQVEFMYEVHGKLYVAVTTLVLPTTSDPAALSLPQSFNATICCVSFMKRIAWEILNGHWHSYKLHDWCTALDDLCVRHLDSGSFNAPQLVQLSYYLQRSALLRLAQTSPDEWAVYLLAILRRDSTQCLHICRPLITMLTPERQQLPLNPDVLRDARPMVVDASNYVIVRYSDPNDAALHATRAIAQQLQLSRWPVPWYKDTPIGKSQDRYVLSRLGVSTASNLPSSEVSLEAYITYIHSKL
ncbi:AaceriAAL068Cp [[Ashbya] aceris (nom. inval.)]|nr:AaceriAAL068Cp [[Ashbya] aceris (nom. inval.)]